MKALTHLLIGGAISLLVQSARAQGALPTFTYGPRGGLVKELFGHADGESWDGRVSGRWKCSGGGFAEWGIHSGRLRLRAELLYAANKQHFSAKLDRPSRIDLYYTAHELHLVPQLLVRVAQKRPLYALAGVELAHALASSRVRGEQNKEVGYQEYETSYVNDRFRPAHNLDPRITIGFSAYLRQRLDATLRLNHGLRSFTVYAPGSSGSAFSLHRSSTPAQQADAAGEPGYRAATYYGVQLSLGYHFR